MAFFTPGTFISATRMVMGHVSQSIVGTVSSTFRLPACAANEAAIARAAAVQRSDFMASPSIEKMRALAHDDRCDCEHREDPEPPAGPRVALAAFVQVALLRRALRRRPPDPPCG